MVFFTSDMHFSHANIIRYSERPYFNKITDVIQTGEKSSWVSKFIARQRADEMDKDLVAKWNQTVKPDDIVYHLGDFAYGSTANVLKHLRMLNGKKKILWGNHDDNLKQVSRIMDFYPDLKNKVEFLGDYAEVNIEGQSIILCHYAMKVWNGSHHGSWQLYGHSHGSLTDDPNSLSFDVGIDCHNYKPLTFQEVKMIISKKKWKVLDHHGAGRVEGGGVGLDKDAYAKTERKRTYLQLKAEFEPS